MMLDQDHIDALCDEVDAFRERIRKPIIEVCESIRRSIRSYARSAEFRRLNASVATAQSHARHWHERDNRLSHKRKTRARRRAA